MLPDIRHLNSAAKLLIRYGRDTAATHALAAVESIRSQLRTQTGPAWREREARRVYEEVIKEIVANKMAGRDIVAIAQPDSETTTVDLAAALVEADKRARKRLADDEDDERYVVMEDEDLPPVKPGPPGWRGIRYCWWEPPDTVDELRAALRASLARAHDIEYGTAEVL